MRPEDIVIGGMYVGRYGGNKGKVRTVAGIEQNFYELDFTMDDRILYITQGGSKGSTPRGWFADWAKERIR